MIKSPFICQQASVDIEGTEVVFASSYVDLPGLLAIEPLLRKLPLICYFHENQLTYPSQNGLHSSAFVRTQLLSAMRCNQVWFNSGWHLEDFFTHLPKFLKESSFPLSLTAKMRKKSKVMHLGVNLEYTMQTQSSAKVVLGWTHRPEYDKGYDRWLNTLEKLHDAGADFHIICTSKPTKNYLSETIRIKNKLKNKILHWGFCEDKKDYLVLLSRIDVFLSMARHEFFGLSAMEAVFSGALPLLPMDLSYPELFDALNNPETFYKDESDLWKKLNWMLSNPKKVGQLKKSWRERFVFLRRYSWKERAQFFDQEIQILGSRGGQGLLN